MSVGHRFERGECFRRNDEECFGGIEIEDGFGEICAIHIGNETKSEGAIAVMLQRFVGHHRSEVGAADADVDHVANALACVPFPFAASDALCEVSHPIEHSVDLRHYVFAVHHDGRSFERAKGHVEDRAVLGDVDLLPVKHRVDSRPQAGFLGQLQEKLQGFIRDAILRVVQEDACRFDRQPLTAHGIVCEKCSQMGSANSLVVRLKGLPRLSFRERLETAFGFWCCLHCPSD